MQQPPTLLIVYTKQIDVKIQIVLIEFLKKYSYHKKLGGKICIGKTDQLIDKFSWIRHCKQMIYSIDKY